MFTSRAEYRLLLREDNADQRLTPIGRRVGLVGEQRWERYCVKCEAMARGRERLGTVRIGPNDREVADRLGLGSLQNGYSLEDLLRRPNIHIEDLAALDETLAGLSREVAEQLEIGVKYEGYIRRQLEQVERFRRTEDVVIPENFDYRTIAGLSAEVREKLDRVRPRTLGQAGRIPGVTPAAIAILAVLLRRS
jgi:tRNA uridine 5-carboxymethylaminomethyl modification enzyme